VLVGRDQRRRRTGEDQPPLCVMTIHAERTRPDCLLVQPDIAEKFARERLYALRVPRIKDTVSRIVLAMRDSAETEQYRDVSAC